MHQFSKRQAAQAVNFPPSSSSFQVSHFIFLGGLGTVAMLTTALASRRVVRHSTWLNVGFIGCKSAKWYMFDRYFSECYGLYTSNDVELHRGSELE